MTDDAAGRADTVLSGHGGIHAVAAATAFGVDTMFTLSGAHVFPLYDAAVGGKDGAAGGPAPMRLVDVRHEQTAVFAAEGLAKLTRTPGLAVLTAGPGVTNGVSAVTTAHFNGTPLVVLGGRAPDYRWGTGALQELDQPPLLSAGTKHAATVHETSEIGRQVANAFSVATAPHRGPVFLDVPMDVLFSHADAPAPRAIMCAGVSVDPDDLEQIVTLLADSARPVLVLGSDVWTGSADGAALRLAEATALPVVANGMGRGVLPAGHRLLVTRARSTAFTEADLLIVVGTPLDFRLGYGTFGSARVVHVADTARGVSTHVELAGAAAGDLTTCLDGIRAGWESLLRRPRYEEWSARSAMSPAPPRIATGTCSPPTPTRSTRRGSTGSCSPGWPGRRRHRRRRRLRVVRRAVRRAARAGRLAGPGAVRLPGHRARLRDRRTPGPALEPGRALLGDGAAGFSLMDVDTLVRHRLPVVMVMGNNGIWGLEKHPMQFLYQYDVAAELRPGTRYDQLVAALGAAARWSPPGRDRTCSRPGVRRRSALPGERHHRPRGRLPPEHDRGVIARAPLSRSA